MYTVTIGKADGVCQACRPDNEMTIKGIYRQDRYELPVDSVRELIANAVVHRSYLNYGSIQATAPNRLF